MTSARAVSICALPFAARSKPAALNMPHLVGMRAVATRQIIPISAADFMYAHCLLDMLPTCACRSPILSVLLFGNRLSDGRSRRLLFCRHGTARVQCVDFTRAESDLLEDLLVVCSQRRGSPRRHLGDAMHLNRTADRRAQLAACA